ncbi:Smr/MutS family protein [Luteitalea sp.]
MTSPRAYVPGEAVLVVALKRRGAIVERRGRAYRVAVGGLTITCRDDELQRVVVAARGRTPPRVVPPRRTTRTGTTDTQGGAAHQAPVPGRASGPRTKGEDAVSSIDLHGFTTLEVREALLTHLDAAIRAGHAVVEVVHGIGTGKVRATVLAELQRLPVVREIRRHPTNRGVTLVFL